MEILGCSLGFKVWPIDQRLGRRGTRSGGGDQLKVGWRLTVALFARGDERGETAVLLVVEVGDVVGVWVDEVVLGFMGFVVEVSENLCWVLVGVG